MLQKKQNNSLINCVVSQEEQNFVIAFEGENKLSTCVAKENREKLIDVLSKWRWMSGINHPNEDEDDIAQELILISKFLIENYPKLNLEEISLAINLSLTNKLNVDVRTFNSFSPMYISRILNAYLDYKRSIYNELRERQERINSKNELEKKATPEDRLFAMRELLHHFYDEYKSIGVVNDYFNVLYNFLRKTKRLNPSKEIVDKAMKYGESKCNEHINSYFANAIGNDKPDKQLIIKRFARNYCVQNLFDTINIDELASNLNYMEFKDV
jgi:hypothetical protein